MNIIQLFRNLRPFVKKYSNYVYGTLLLTLIGSFIAQVNAFVLKYTVDSISKILPDTDKLQEGMHILISISVILVAKEILNSLFPSDRIFSAKN